MITRYVTGIYRTYLSTLSKKRLQKKMNTIMVGLCAGSSSMATVFKAIPSQPPLCDSMADGAVKGFFLIMSIGK
jgi:hypothetical protein